MKNRMLYTSADIPVDKMVTGTEWTTAPYRSISDWTRNDAKSVEFRLHGHVKFLQHCLGLHFDTALKHMIVCYLCADGNVLISADNTQLNNGRMFADAEPLYPDCYLQIERVCCILINYTPVAADLTTGRFEACHVFGAAIDMDPHHYQQVVG